MQIFDVGVPVRQCQPRGRVGAGTENQEKPVGNYITKPSPRLIFSRRRVPEWPCRAKALVSVHASILQNSTPRLLGGT